MIEVEVRGKIDAPFSTLLERFRKCAQFVEEKERFSLIYFADSVPDDVRAIRDEKIDLRLRVTNKQAEIALKYGIWGVSENRKEILIPFPLEKFDAAVELLKHLGWTRGVAMATKTFVFQYRGVEFSLVQASEHAYFEAENSVSSERDIGKARERLLAACKDLGLSIFTNGEFISMINAMNNAPDAQFDFTHNSFASLKKNMRDSFNSPAINSFLLL